MADYWKYHNNRDFRNKSQGVLAKVSRDVMDEASGTVGHAERVAFAKTVFDGTVNMEPIYRTLITESALRTKITANEEYLAELVDAMEAIYNDLAGVAT